MIFAYITLGLAFGIVFTLMFIDAKPKKKPLKRMLRVTDLQYLKYLMKFNETLDYLIHIDDKDGIKKLGVSYNHLIKQTDVERMKTAHEILSKYRTHRTLSYN